MYESTYPCTGTRQHIIQKMAYQFQARVLDENDKKHILHLVWAFRPIAGRSLAGGRT